MWFVSHCHWSWSTEKALLFFVEVHCGARRKHVPFSSGNRGLWQEGKWTLQTLPIAERHQEAPQRELWEAPRATTEFWEQLQGEPRPSGIPLWRNKCLEFLQQGWNDSKRAWNYYKGSMNIEPSAVRNNKLAFPQTQEMYRKLPALPYKQSWYINIVSPLPVAHQKCLNTVVS